jgi:glyoxylase-like metal-dependent hydrolase (beta-lactamase superfamily II)
MQTIMQHLHRLTWFNQINVYLISTPQGPVLVDSAAPGAFRWLVKSLRQVGIKPEQLAGVVVTHFHLDHVGTAIALQKCGVPMYALAAEVPILMGDAPHASYSGTAGKILLAAERLFFGSPAFVGVRSLSVGERLLGTTWRVVAAPGHTPGSLALYNEETGDLLSGDTLVSDFGCPRANLSFFTADRDRLIESALNLMALEPKYIHPGHGKPLPLSAYAKVQERLVDKITGDRDTINHKLFR